MSSGFQFTRHHLELIRDYPHVLGNMLGKDKLGPMHSYWVRYMWDRMEDSALQGHRGSRKTTAVAIIGIIRRLLFYPNRRIAIVRKTFTDAAEVTTAIMQLMEKPECKALFEYAHGIVPKATTRQYGKLTYNFKTSITPEGSVTAHGMDGSIVGKHYDDILADDIITMKDRVSRAERDRTKEIAMELFTNIIDPGQPIRVMGTPWHRDDAWSVIPVKPIKFPISKTDILSPEEIEAKRKKTTPFLFSINYDLEIANEKDALFKDPVYGQWDVLQAITNGAFAHLDAAFDGDHYCALTIGSRRSDRRLQLAGYTYPGNVKDWIPTIKELCTKYKVKLLYNETNPDKGYTADALRAAGVAVETYSENANKHNKIATVLYDSWGDIIWDERSDPEYMNQVIDYREGQEPDDAPDSASSLLQRAFNKQAINLALWR